MSKLKTLLEIFQNEPDDAEIRRENEDTYWTHVKFEKCAAHSWDELQKRKWVVRRKPREFEALEYRGSLYPSYWSFDPEDKPKPIKVREILDE